MVCLSYALLYLILLCHHIFLQYGTSALVWASRKGHTEIVECLLSAGANVDTAGMVSCMHVHRVMLYCTAILYNCDLDSVYCSLLSPRAFLKGGHHITPFAFKSKSAGLYLHKKS